MRTYIIRSPKPEKRFFKVPEEPFGEPAAIRRISDQLEPIIQLFRSFVILHLQSDEHHELHDYNRKSQTSRIGIVILSSTDISASELQLQQKILFGKTNFQKYFYSQNDDFEQRLPEKGDFGRIIET